MNAPKNLDRLIRTYLIEDQATGHSEVPDRVYNAIRHRIEQTHQRAVIGSRGVPDMNKFVAVGLAAAAVVAVLLIGAQLRGTPIPGGPSETQAAAPSEAPASVEPSRSGDGSLPIGLHVMGGQLHGEDRVTVTIPAPGWFAPDEGSLTKDLGGGDRVTVVVVPGDYYTVPRNICNWQIDDADLRATRMPQTANELVAYLAEQPYGWPDGSLTRDFSAPEDITIDGSHGQRIMDAVPEYPDSDPNACDEQRFCTLQDRDSWGCLLSHPEPGALDTLWVVDPPENRNYLLVVASSGLPDTVLRTEMNAIVNSMTFYVE
jgi:hypothetical protein